MSNIKNVMGQAANTLTKPLNVEDVFSTYLYEGTSSAQTITNGIDLDGEGGLVWMKNRTSSSYSHALQHTTIADGGYLSSNSTAAFQAAANNGISAFNSNGFTFDTGNWEEFNNSSHDYVSWTFRKAPKFFDVVTYTGTGSARSISHDLDADVGMLIVKATSGTTAWRVWTNTFTGTERLQLNDTSAKATTNTSWDGKTPTSTEFYLGADTNTNNSGTTYVAYLFAHNDGDGDFGPNGNADIIKCGSYTGNQNVVGPVIDLGFEPQWLLIKNASAIRPWLIIDVMRGTAVGTTNAGFDQYLEANTSNAEDVDAYLSINATGFQPRDTGGNINASGETYIYMAIRRGPMAVPESGTEVFSPNLASGYPRYPSGFATDFVIQTARDSGSNSAYSRMQGINNLSPNSTAQESVSNWDWAQMDGSGTNFTSTNYIGWSWKRAPGYFDVVAYTGTGSPNNGYRDVTHNLSVQPEMMWLKCRDSTSEWVVNHKDAGAGYLNTTNAFNAYPRNGFSHNDAFTTTTFSAKAQDEWNFNVSGSTYIAYLFATLDGVSKVGSFSHTFGTDTTVDCGFTSGARFVLIKNYDTSGDWYVFDSERGIVAGDDKMLELNTTNAENTGDFIDPHPSGFTLVGNSWGSRNCIFYAIA